MWCPAADDLIQERQVVQAHSQAQANVTADGQCCYGKCGWGCNPSGHYCDSKETCTKDASDGGCDSSADGVNAEALWCPTRWRPDETDGQCCYGKCGQGCNPSGHYCDSKETCTKDASDGGCDSSADGVNAKAMWCPMRQPPDET